MSRPFATAAALTVLSLTASGCVTVHGEREVLPAATKAEAARALKDFTAAYNAADKALDPALDADRVTGPLSAINQAGLKARRASNPDGNPNHVPLTLTDARFTIPKQAGWPKFFVADTDSNRDRDDDPKLDNRWVLVFLRSGPDAVWEAAYLTVMAPDKVPEFRLDKDGLARPVAADSPELSLAPKDLSQAYATYLEDGGDAFAPGTHTSAWREQRLKSASRPGLAKQYVDQPMTSGAYAPLALRTKDGGALVFFSTHHFEKQTASKGLNLAIGPDVKALMTGDAKQSVTLERVSNQAVLDPTRTATDPKVQFLSRIQGLTGAKGE
ncbi:hypothetical protein ACFVT5_35295 [Streptomyces sp. NPDC058001]|uniref:hypothetical protein n=1 Tax=Streptomyces sp. NPDC058001 TaxID=3346300 RepID=UPI0036E87263